MRTLFFALAVLFFCCLRIEHASTGIARPQTTYDEEELLGFFEYALDLFRDVAVLNSANIDSITGNYGPKISDLFAPGKLPSKVENKEAAAKTLRIRVLNLAAKLQQVMPSHNELAGSVCNDDDPIAYKSVKIADAINDIVEHLLSSLKQHYNQQDFIMLQFSNFLASLNSATMLSTMKQVDLIVFLTFLRNEFPEAHSESSDDPGEKLFRILKGRGGIYDDLSAPAEPYVRKLLGQHQFNLMQKMLPKKKAQTSLLADSLQNLLNREDSLNKKEIEDMRNKLNSCYVSYTAFPGALQFIRNQTVPSGQSDDLEHTESIKKIKNLHDAIKVNEVYTAELTAVPNNPWKTIGHKLKVTMANIFNRMDPSYLFFADPDGKKLTRGMTSSIRRKIHEATARSFKQGNRLSYIDYPAVPEIKWQNEITTKEIIEHLYAASKLFQMINFTPLGEDSKISQDVWEWSQKQNATEARIGTIWLAGRLKEWENIRDELADAGCNSYDSVRIKSIKTIGSLRLIINSLREKLMQQPEVAPEVPSTEPRPTLAGTFFLVRQFDYFADIMHSKFRSLKPLEKASIISFVELMHEKYYAHRGRLFPSDGLQDVPPVYIFDELRWRVMLALENDLSVSLDKLKKEVKGADTIQKMKNLVAFSLTNNDVVTFPQLMQFFVLDDAELLEKAQKKEIALDKIAKEITNAEDQVKESLLQAKQYNEENEYAIGKLKVKVAAKEIAKAKAKASGKVQDKKPKQKSWILKPFDKLRNYLHASTYSKRMPSKY